MSTRYTIDAAGKTIGRIATEAAVLLMGKDVPADYKKNSVRTVSVSIVNAAKISIQPKKLIQKTYHSHSGYPGSDRATPLQDIIAKKGHEEALRRAIKGMLPGNTLRDKRLKNLHIEK